MSKKFNKSELADKYKQGHTGKAASRTGWYKYGSMKGVAKDPFEFANSSQYAKMKRKK